MAGQKTLMVTVAIFLLAITILGLVFLSILSQWSNVDARMDWVRHTQRVLQTLDGLEGSLRDIGVAGRDYLSDPKEQHWAAFHRGRVGYEARYAQLLRLTQDNPVQQRNIKRSQARIQNKMLIWDALLQERQRQGRPDPSWLAASLKTMTISDLLTHIFTIRSEEYRLLSERIDASAKEINQSRTFGLTAFFICVSFLLATSSFLWMQIKRRLQAEASLQAVNADLENRIQTRTQELAQANLHLRAAIEAQKKAQAEQQQMNQRLESRVAERTLQLETTNKELESFSYSVSHDLRTPLRAIVGFARMLGDRLDARLEDEDRRLLNIIRDNAGKMSALIDDLLAFSRLGRAGLSKQAIDMDKSVNEVLHELLPISNGPMPDIRLGPLPPAVADRNLIRQVWSNLIGNALKFSSHVAQPVITISGSIDGDFSHYRVQDNGAGFDMRFYDKLFGVFQRLHGADEFPGTGVGLAIVQRIVSRHDGRVWAEGETGRGAVFHFTLPRGSVPR